MKTLKILFKKNMEIKNMEEKIELPMVVGKDSNGYLFVDIIYFTENSSCVALCQRFCSPHYKRNTIQIEFTLNIRPAIIQVWNIYRYFRPIGFFFSDEPP